MPVPANHNVQAPPHASTTPVRLRPTLAVVGLAGALCGLLALLWIGIGGWQDQPDLAHRTPWMREAVFVLALGGLVGLAVVAVAYLKAASANASEAGRHRSRQYRGNLQLLDLMQVPVALCDANHVRAQINTAMADLFGIERGDALDLPLDWQRFVIAEDWPAFAEAMGAAHRTGRQQWLQIRIRSGDPEPEVQAQIVAVPDASSAEGHTAELTMAVVLHPPEGTVAQQSIRRLRALLEMAEAEKWHFGQAVHDELGQRLSGIAYFAKALQRKLELAQRPESDDAGWLTNLANESMSVARGLARGLVPVGTDDPGALAAMLVELCQNTSKMFGTRCTLHADDKFDPGGAARANHLYRAVQELMTNAIKHGGAQNVTVSLEVHARGQHVGVHNVGSSLGAATAAMPKHRGMGLNGVRSRVAYLGGQFTLTDGNAGVLASIELPMHSDAAAPLETLGAAAASPDWAPPASSHHEDP